MCRYLYGKPDTPRATPEVVAAVEEEVEGARRIGEGGWEAALKILEHAGDWETGQQLARNDWYRLKRALEIVKVRMEIPVIMFHSFLCCAMSSRVPPQWHRIVASGITFCCLLTGVRATSHLLPASLQSWARRLCLSRTTC